MMNLPCKTLTIVVSISGTIFGLQGCAAPIAAAAYAGYANIQANGELITQTNLDKMSCSQINNAISLLNNKIEDHYALEVNKELNRYPTAAGQIKVVTQTASSIANHTNTVPASYLQPLLATATHLLSNNDVNQVLSEKDTLVATYNNKCVSPSNTSKKQTLEMQRHLTRIGYPCGVVDGIYGTNTKESIMRYQADKGLPIDGLVTDELLAKIANEP